jgi:lipopolysaccharide exporter
LHRINAEVTFPNSSNQRIAMELNTRNSSFGIDVLKLVSGTTFAQAANILAIPFLVRLYSPEAFGLLALFISLASILTIMSCLRYEMSIMLPESDEESANLLAASLAISLLFSAVLIPFVWLAGPLISKLLNVPALTGYLWFLPLVTIFGGTSLGHPALNQWNSRAKQFGRLSKVQVINTSVMISIQLALGFKGFTTGGSLIGGVIAGSVCSTAILFWRVWQDEKALFYRSVRLQAMLHGIQRYYKFPLYDAWGGVLNTASWQLPTFFLSAFFSQTIVGYYALSFRLLKLPTSLIGTAIGQVFFQRAAVAYTEGRLASVVESNLRRLVLLGMFPILLLTILGQDVFIIVLGPTWSEAGVYAQILSIWMFVWFISHPLSTLFRVLERQEFLLLINAAIFFTRLVTLGIGGILQDARLALILFSASGFILYGYLNLSVATASGTSLSRVGDILLRGFLPFLPAGAILILMKVSGVNSLTQVGIAIFLLALYLCYQAIVSFNGLGIINSIAFAFRRDINR